MTDPAASHASFKEKALEELRQFWIIAIYLALFLGCFNLYRRLLLAEIGIPYYLSYGIKLIEALIVAKVILIGEALGVGGHNKRSRMIFTVLQKSLLFGVFIALFYFLESAVEALVHHSGWLGIEEHLFGKGIYELLARVLVMMVGLVPFFAFVELEQVLGQGKLGALLFSRRQATQ